jgi:hypothetical protein
MLPHVNEIPDELTTTRDRVSWWWSKLLETPDVGLAVSTACAMDARAATTVAELENATDAELERTIGNIIAELEQLRGRRHIGGALPAEDGTTDCPPFHYHGFEKVNGTCINCGKREAGCE